MISMSTPLTEVISSIAEEVTTRSRDIIGLRRVGHRIVRREEETLFGEVLERRGRRRRLDCRGAYRQYCSTRDRRCEHLQSVFSNQI